MYMDLWQARDIGNSLSFPFVTSAAGSGTETNFNQFNAYECALLERTRYNQGH